jgi:hypothetical protein
MSVALTSPRPSVTIGDARGSVTIGTGRRSITLTSPAVVSITGVSSRVEIAAAPRVVTVGAKQGIAGPPGPGAEIEIYTAAVPLGGHRAVALDASGTLIYAASDLGIPAIGVIRDAVASGADVAVYRAGRVGGFTGLVPGSVYYLASTGLLTLTPAGSGVLQPLGIAASTTEFLVDPDYPTFL